MKSIKIGLLSLMFFITNPLLAQYTETINSNVPGMSMSPYSIGKKVFQIETNAYMINETKRGTYTKGTGKGGNFSLRYGVYKEELEAVVTGELRSVNYEGNGNDYKIGGLRTFSVGAKYLFYDPFKNYVEKVNVYSWKAQHKFKWRRLRPAIAGYVGAGYIGNGFSNRISNTGSNLPSLDKQFGPKAMILLHNNFNNGMILTTNLLCNYFLDKTMNYGFILTLSKGFNEYFSVFVENETYFGNYNNRMVFSLGATYAVLDNLQVHASVSNSPSSTFYTDQTYGGLGLSWRFDRNHTPVEHRVPANKEKKQTIQRN
jgi:hypothetical protein